MTACDAPMSWPYAVVLVVGLVCLTAIILATIAAEASIKRRKS